MFNKAKFDKKIVQIYTELGFDESVISNEFDSVSQLKTLNLSEILSHDLANEFKKFSLNDGSSVIYVSGFVNSDKSHQILAKYGAFSVDFVSLLNQNLTDAKIMAVILKIVAFFVAFAVLWLFFGIIKSLVMMFFITFGVIFTLCLLVIFGININIFAVFGLILASAVGIDYMIFAMNLNLTQKERIFGILAASITSFISFFALSFSATNAISVFGLSVSLCIAFYGVCASVLSVKFNRSCG